MDPDGINVLHITNDYTIIRLIAHNFIFDFFPAGNGPFHEDLIDRAEFDAARGNHEELFFVMSNAAACTAQGIRRSDDNRIADSIREVDRSLHFLENIAFRYGLINVFHRFFKALTVFRFFNGTELRAQQTHLVFIQNAVVGQFDSHIQAHLTAQCRQDTVRTLFFDNPCYIVKRDRFDIHTVGNIFIRHNRRRIAVD